MFSKADLANVGTPRDAEDGGARERAVRHSMRTKHGSKELRQSKGRGADSQVEEPVSSLRKSKIKQGCTAQNVVVCYCLRSRVQFSNEYSQLSESHRFRPTPLAEDERESRVEH
jgi:hypothetical protein